jgi:16S rRNA (cytosine1402-N4)-methyltransferase
MPDEIVHWLSEINPRVIVDGTFGGGGHSELLLPCIPKFDASKPESSGLIIGLDRDPAVSERIESQEIDPRISVFLGSYEQVPKAMAAMEVESIDAMVLDLGLSSDQLADRDRGFSFTEDGPLDLRFDPENGHPASDWLAWKKEQEIADAIYQFGEERYSRRIAREIIARRRREDAVETVSQLVDVCRRCVPRSKNHDIHPATRTFQALRIAVNDELGILTRTLSKAADWFPAGGRLAVISFHSLEDRITKNTFRDDERWEVLTKKPLRPSDEEVRRNPRSRSAKLRVAQRI